MRDEKERRSALPTRRISQIPMCLRRRHFVTATARLVFAKVRVSKG